MTVRIPKVSVITPCYNSGSTLAKTIQSVVEQSHTDIEYVIVDGGSKDNSVEIIKEYQRTYPHIIQYTSGPDKGIYDAMNIGTRMASGEWVMYLGADDYLYSNESVANLFKNINADQYDLIYGNVMYSDDTIGGGEYTRYRLMNNNIPHQAILYRRTKVLEYGGYDLKYKIWADYVMNIKFFSEKEFKVIYINEIVSYFSLEGISSFNLDKQFIKDCALIYIKYFSPYFNAKELHMGFMSNIYLQLKYVDFCQGVRNMWKAGKLFKNWRDVLYCIRVRLGLTKENIKLR